MKGMQKVRRGKNFAGVVLYALKPSPHHKTDPVVIGSNMLEHSASELIAEFTASAALRLDVMKPVWHNSLRLPKGDSVSNKRWVKIADDYMSRLGFSDTHLRCYVMHDDEAGQHVHIIASRVDLVGGKLYLGKNENLASGRIIQDLEVDYGLTRTQGFSPSHKPYHASNRKKLSRNEQQMENREQVPAPKTFLQNTIDELIATNSDIHGFVEALAENGIKPLPNISSTGRMNGFSFEYSGIAFKASQLDKAYSWATLQEKLRYAPERDNPLLFALKAPAMKSNETGDSVTEDMKEDTAPSLTAAMTEEVTARPVQHEHRAEAAETREAHTPASIVLTALEPVRKKDYIMTSVIKWLLSIPYLTAFTELLKKADKKFLHRKSSFSIISAISLAEPSVKTSNEITEDFIKNPYTPN